MTKQKLWHAFLVAGGMLAILAPDIADLAATLQGINVPWLRWPIRILGGIALIGSRWDKIRAKVQPFLTSEVDTKPNITGPGAAAAVLLVGSLMLSGTARAATPQALGCLDTANTYCVVPAAAVGMQINLKTGTMANAVSLVGLTLQHTFGSLPLGIGVYGGLGASSANRGSYQGCLGASITSWGLLCGGVQRLAGEPVWQGVLTFAGQLSYGGTPAYVREVR